MVKIISLDYGKRMIPNERSYIGPNYNYNFTRLPVTPAKPPKPKRRKSSTATPPTQVELQTAETLLELSGRRTAPTEQPYRKPK